MASHWSGVKRSASQAEFEDNPRFRSGFKPRKLCTFFLQGRCQKGPDCTFAHSEDELAPDARDEQQHVLAEVAAVEEEALMAAAEAAFDDERSALSDLDFPAMEAPSDRQSLLQGPRDFGTRLPDKLCQMWLRHPVMCTQGDFCPLAHGLLEMGIENSDSVAVETRSNGLTSDVRILSLEADERSRVRPTSAPPLIVGASKGKNGCKGKSAFSKGSAGKGGCKGKGADSRGKGPPAAFAALPMHPAAETYTTPELGLPLSRFVGGRFQPNKLCSFWVQSPAACTKGDQCTFAHGVHELVPSAIPTCGVNRFLHTGFAPTKYCQFFAEGRCTKGLTCTFAHSADEMSQNPGATN